MTLHITAYRGGFATGITEITRLDDTESNTGIALSVLILDAGQSHEFKTVSETAFLLMNGAVVATVGGEVRTLSRGSLFDESPSCIHVCAESIVRLSALTAVELTVYRTANCSPFPGRILVDVPDEHRGRDLVDNACYRLVRTIFDRASSHENAELVLGEVVTLPGRWSSYPPHHHSQPELYHYRFTRPQGFGFAQLGGCVVEVKQYDTVKILAGLDHAQVAAPGYGMYYAWVIRHLPGNPYIAPEFTAEHAWTLEAEDVWRPVGAANAQGRDHD